MDARDFVISAVIIQEVKPIYFYSIKPAGILKGCSSTTDRVSFIESPIVWTIHKVNTDLLALYVINNYVII